MSPLLRSLTYTQAALGPVIGSMLLQCYCALDAFRRGYDLGIQHAGGRGGPGGPPRY